MDDITEVTQLVVRERQSRVRRLSAEASECFQPDATVTTSWHQGSAKAFVSASAHGLTGSTGPTVNRLGPPVVRLSGRRAVVELPSTTIHWIDVNGQEAELTTLMRLLYRVESRDGEWRISDLTAINESDMLGSAVPGTDLRIDCGAVVGLRHSYRWLSYTRSLVGEKVSPELFGIDRIDEVNDLYERASAWLVEPPSDVAVQA